MSFHTKNHQLLERLDQAIEWTGLHQLSGISVRRRRMRWLPMVTLTIATAGLAIILFFPSDYWFGYAGLMFGFGASNFLPIFGPVKQPLNPLDDADEREKILRRDAFFVAFAAISAAAFICVWALIGLSVVKDWPRDVLLRAMMGVNFYLMAIFSAIPTLYASWVTSEPTEDGD